MPDQPSLDEVDALLEALQEQRADAQAVADIVAQTDEPEWLTALHASLANPDDPDLEDAAWTAYFEHRNSPDYRPQTGTKDGP